MSSTSTVLPMKVEEGETLLYKIYSKWYPMMVSKIARPPFKKPLFGNHDLRRTVVIMYHVGDPKKTKLFFYQDEITVELFKYLG